MDVHLLRSADLADDVESLAARLVDGVGGGSGCAVCSATSREVDGLAWVPG